MKEYKLRLWATISPANLTGERINAVESMRDKLLEIIKTLPEDRLQVIFEFVNRMNQGASQADDYDQLLMNDTHLS